MQGNKILFIIFISFMVGLTSCVSTVPTVSEDKIEFTNQEKAELSVKAYLRHTYDSIAEYTRFSFGKVEEIIPDQVLHLQELKEMRKLLPGMKDNYGNKLDSIITVYDSLIAQQEREITNKKIRSFWKISHIYTIKFKGDSIYACEFDFTLDPNFKMYDAKALMYEKLTVNEHDWFNFYFMQYPLFDTYDYESDIKRSQEIYNFFDQKLIGMKENKGEVLKRILFIIQHIKTSGEFTNQKIAEAVIANEMRTQYGKNYSPGKYSVLKALINNSANGSQELLGYSIVHTFVTTSDNLMVENGLYFEFDPWMILAGYLPAETPYDKYFDK